MNLMLAIIDGRSPTESIDNLKKHVDDVLLFESIGITSNSISGHPDIFIFQYGFDLIIAPNSPQLLFEFLDKHQVSYSLGQKIVGEEFKNCVSYNCLSTEEYFFHKAGFAEEEINKLNHNKKFVNLPQAFTRCSLTHLGNNKYISSDNGVVKKLAQAGLECFYFSPDQISIPGHKNGFFGGTNGSSKNKIFFNGNVDLHEHGQTLRKYIEDMDIEIVSLNHDFLYDGGGIFFLENY